MSDGAAVVAAASAAALATTAEPVIPATGPTPMAAARSTAAPTGESASSTTSGPASSAPSAAAPGATATEATAEPANAGALQASGAALQSSGALVAAPAVKTTATTQAAVRPTFGESPSPASSFGGTVFALLLVVSLILALGWLARRMPGFARGASGSGLRVVTSVALGAREKLVVVEVGNTQLLLGVGPGGTRTLHTLEEPLPEAASPTAIPPFAQLLAQQFGKKA